MKILKKTLSIILFWVILLGLVVMISEIFFVPTYYYTQSVAAFDKEKKNTVDGVAIGTSVVGYGFLPTIAFNEFGITTHHFGGTVEPVGAIPAILDYVSSKQDVKFVLIDVHGFRKSAIIAGASKANSQKIYSSIPLSVNRYKVMNAIIDFSERVYEQYGYPEDESTIISRDDPGMYFPFYDTHMRWTTNSVKKADYVDVSGNYKGTYVESSTSFKTVNMTKYEKAKNYESAPIDDFQTELLDELTDYLSKQSYKAIFINYPSFNPDTQEGELISVMEYLKEKGCATIDISSKQAMKKIGLDVATDFYDRGHVNSKGGIKVTRYLMENIKEILGSDYVDHRNQSGYEDWDSAVDYYVKFLKKGWANAEPKVSFNYKRLY